MSVSVGLFLFPLDFLLILVVIPFAIIAPNIMTLLKMIQASSSHFIPKNVFAFVSILGPVNDGLWTNFACDLTLCLSQLKNKVPKI